MLLVESKQGAGALNRNSIDQPLNGNTYKNSNCVGGERGPDRAMSFSKQPHGNGTEMLSTAHPEDMTARSVLWEPQQSRSSVQNLPVDLKG